MDCYFLTVMIFPKILFSFSLSPSNNLLDYISLPDEVTNYSLNMIHD